MVEFTLMLSVVVEADGSMPPAAACALAHIRTRAPRKSTWQLPISSVSSWQWYAVSESTV